MEIMLLVEGSRLMRTCQEGQGRSMWSAHIENEIQSVVLETGKDNHQLCLVLGFVDLARAHPHSHFDSDEAG